MSVEAKDKTNCICCFSVKSAALRSKIKDCLAGNHDVSKWRDMSTPRLVFQRASNIQIQLSLLV